MPITINGSGTITGLSAGGLPDGSIVQAELATGVAGTGPAFSAYASAGTSLTANIWTKISLATEEFDTNSNFASSRFTPTVAGYYQLNALVESGIGISYFYVSIYKNGVDEKRNSTGNNVATGCEVTALIYLNGSTDYVEVYANSPTTQTTATGSKTTFFQGYLARAA